MSPHLGQHSIEVLLELGYDEAMAQALCRDGVVQQASS
jgi:crotonobetainyl-CoA:carnitine CoA-transferase CaiB-like acyl-CoA transferase